MSCVKRSMKDCEEGFAEKNIEFAKELINNFSKEDWLTAIKQHLRFLQNEVTTKKQISQSTEGERPDFIECDWDVDNAIRAYISRLLPEYAYINEEHQSIEQLYTNHLIRECKPYSLICFMLNLHSEVDNLDNWILQRELNRLDKIWQSPEVKVVKVAV